MVLHANSDTAQLTMPEAGSFYEDNFYLSDWPSPSPIKTNPERNGTIHMECKTILNVVSSEAEYETCGISNNGKTSIGMRSDLITLDHKQPATPLKTDNSMTEGFINSMMKPKHSRIWDMKLHWLRNKEVLEQMRVYWDKLTNNEADYFTKITPKFTIIKCVLGIYIPRI